MNTSPVKAGDIVLGKYRVDRVLGQGGMGVLVAASHVHLTQRVAFKFMLAHKGPESEAFKRFVREAEASVRLRTEHVAKVLDVGQLDENTPYIMMELLEGRDLTAVLQEGGVLPVTEAVDYVLQACEALAEAHAIGIVHRDIKPANLFLTRTAAGAPSIKVLDFGISKVIDDSGVSLTKTEQTLGSPLYMSPEQMNCSKDVDARTDLWSLGVTLYELLGGRTPFHAETSARVITRVCAEPYTPLGTLRPDMPPGFEAVIGACLEKLPERRWPNIARFAAALGPYASPQGVAYVERVARVLGEQVAAARPTDLLPQEPSPAGPATTAAPARTTAPPTGAATTTSAALLRAGIDTRPSRRTGAVFAAIIAALAAFAGLAAWRWRAGAERGGLATTGPTASTTTSTTSISAAPPSSTAATAPSGSTTASIPTPATTSQPTVEPASTALPSATQSPISAPHPTAGPKPKSAPTKPSTPTTPAPGGGSDLYDRGARK